MNNTKLIIKQKTNIKICKIPFKIPKKSQPAIKSNSSFHKSDATLENEYIKKKKMKKGEVFMIKGGWWF